MKVGKKVKRVHILPKPIKIKLPAPKPAPVEIPQKEAAVR